MKIRIPLNPSMVLKVMAERSSVEAATRDLEVAQERYRAALERTSRTIFDLVPAEERGRLEEARFDLFPDDEGGVWLEEVELPAPKSV